MNRETLLALIADCDDMLALSNSEIEGMGETRENIESARSGCIRDLEYLERN